MWSERRYSLEREPGWTAIDWWSLGLAAVAIVAVAVLGGRL